jgi:hypothetical protein
MTPPEMNYDPNTPLRKDPFSIWQQKMLDNFMVMDPAFAVNHVPLEAVSNAGNHNVVNLLEQDKDLQTGFLDMTAYAKDIPYQTDQLFMRYNGNGTVFQFTNYQIYPLNFSDLQTAYFTTLPGGLIVYFGQMNNPTGNPIQLYPQICTNLMSINCTGINSSAAIKSFSITMQGIYVTSVEAIKQSPVGGPTLPSIFYTIIGNTVPKT